VSEPGVAFVQVKGKVYRIHIDATGTKALRVDVRTGHNRYRTIWRWGPKGTAALKAVNAWRDQDATQPRLL
jgi:hypothetical protein